MTARSIPRSHNGFTLIEVAVVLIILAILATTVGTVTAGQLEARRRSQTEANMAIVESALINFVATTGRMPCPADGSLAQTDANWGLERRNNAAANGSKCLSTATGVVPWRSIGIPVAEATDGWQSLFTFRVPEALVIDNGMKMSDCDPAGALGTPTGSSPYHTCNSGCTTGVMSTCNPPAIFLNAKGFQIQNAAGLVLNNPTGTPATGVAFVLISAGPTYGPAYNSLGVLVPTAGTLGTAEAKNQNNLGLQAFYVDSDPDASATTAHFDDIVKRPTVATILTKANLSARSH